VEKESDRIKPGLEPIDSAIHKIQAQLKVKRSTLELLRKFKSDLDASFEKAGRRKWAGATDRIWAFGPRGNGPNLLINRVPWYERPSLWACVTSGDAECVSDSFGSFHEFDHSLVSGFQLAALSGPLCEEPMQGVCFVIEDWKQERTSGESATTSPPSDSPLPDDIEAGGASEQPKRSGPGVTFSNDLSNEQAAKTETR